MMMASSTVGGVFRCSAIGGRRNGDKADRGFPEFLPVEIERVRDRATRKMARRIERLPVKLCKAIAEDRGQTSCASPTVSIEQLPPCNVTSKREHLYQLFRSYITRPLVLVGASLGAAVAIDFAVNYPEFVSELVLIDASVYAEGTGRLSRLPRPMAYAGVSLLHCLLPWWDDATVDFMLSGGYNVIADINQVKQKTLIIWGEDDRIISNKFAKRLHEDIPNSVLHTIPDCGHVPHIEQPNTVAKLILDFVCEEGATQQIPELSKESYRADVDTPLRYSVAEPHRKVCSNGGGKNPQDLLYVE